MAKKINLFPKQESKKIELTIKKNDTYPDGYVLFNEIEVPIKKPQNLNLKDAFSIIKSKAFKALLADEIQELDKRLFSKKIVDPNPSPAKTIYDKLKEKGLFKYEKNYAEIQLILKSKSNLSAKERNAIIIAFINPCIIKTVDFYYSEDQDIKPVNGDADPAASCK